jgi:hypothetical protein
VRGYRTSARFGRIMRNYLAARQQRLATAATAEEE